jgi:hypothetical protein
MHQLHRVFCRPGWRERALPIECFGDGAKFTDVTSLYTIAWAFKLGRGKQWATKYVFSCIPKAACVSAHGINTLDEIWEHFSRSLLALWLGKHPDLDTGGNPWPPGSLGHRLAGQDILNESRFCVLWDILGDLDHHCNVLHLPHYATPSPCWLCRANRTDMNFLDWRPEAPWRATLVTPEEAQAAPPRHFPLFRILHVSGVTDLNVRPGPMHTIELGVLLYLHGGTLRTFVDAATTTIPGNSREARLRVVWGRIKELYTALGVQRRIPQLTLNKFWPDKKKDFPVLKAKAAASKDLVVVMIELCKEYSTGEPFDMHRIATYLCINEILILCRASWQLLPDSAAKIKVAADRFMMHYNWLALHEARQGRLTYNQTFKMHLFLHIADWSQYENPYIASEYPYEDMMGKVSRVGRSCTRSLPSVRLAFKVLAKVRTTMGLMIGRLHGI